MATRNIVPRGNGEGQLGTAEKHWAKLFADAIHEGANLGNNASLGYRQPNETVTAGTIRYHQSLPTGYYLECTTQGTTSAGDITPTSTIGSTVSDGTLTWTICKEIGTSNVPLVVGYNGKQTFTSSGTFTAPVTGIYKITLQGGGGGGGKAFGSSDDRRGGGGGGQGGHGVFYEKLTAGTSYSYTIGAGGAGGTETAGDVGGSSSITIGSNAYVANGGECGDGRNNGGSGGAGGTFTINANVVSCGAPGSNGNTQTTNVGSCKGGTGGGAGGGANYNAGISGGGGAGGYVKVNSAEMFAGLAGGDGFITFEWQTGSLA